MTESEVNKTGSLIQKFEQQKRELTESLKYASCIQNALLPKYQSIKRNFPEHFLLFMPRDIVSGDFYWAARKRNLSYFAIGDCTGHGVPGAFLSILGISFLTQIVDQNESISAANILNILREHFMKSLQQTGTLEEQKDGVDMAICVIDHENDKLQYAGAFNPVYIIHGSNRLVEIPGDKMPIGIAPESETSFQNHHFNLSTGDMVYMFTDGYVDQFGGAEGKKFKYRPFRNLFMNICSQSMENQKLALVRELKSWMGETPQLDDITIFGFRHSKQKY